MEIHPQLSELAATPSADHARSLIRIYDESEWRSTRLEVVKTLGRFQDSRSFQFLVELILKNEDLAEQQLALLALSQRKTASAGRFLRQFYLRAPDTLKAHTAHALGQVQDEASSPALLKDFDEAFSKQDHFWLRNIILALGELKYFPALPKIRKLVAERPHTDSALTMAGFFALGRLERDPSFLLSLEQKFLEDSLQFQIFQSALSQAQVRSQFKLEDYLSKIFTLPEPHPLLPLELRAFDETEVETGFELFDLGKEWKRMLLALRGLSPQKRVPYYAKILSFLRAQAAQLLVTQQPLTLTENYFWDFLKRESAHPVVLEWALKQKPSEEIEKTSPGALVRWLEVCVDKIDWSQELPLILMKSPSEAIAGINAWSEWGLTQDKKILLEQVEKWFALKLSALPYTRLVRACAELGLANKVLTQRWIQDLSVPDYRPSALMVLEASTAHFELEAFLKQLTNWDAKEIESYGARILAVMDAFGDAFTETAATEKLVKALSSSPSVENRNAVLKLLRLKAPEKEEAFVLDQLSHQNPSVELNAVITLKYYAGSSVASEELVEKLKSPSAIIRGRALDSLCAHTSLAAKRGVMKFLKDYLSDEFVVDKVSRSFDPQRKGGVDFAKQVDQMLQENPDHPQWEKLVQLRDRLQVAPDVAASPEPKVASSAKSAALKEVDQRLIEVIPQFTKLDPMAQAALRAAEEPFRGSEEIQNLPIDKAPTVLEYCKALDLILEKYLGQKFLFPKLETSLHEFQTVWHKIGFIEDYPHAEKVMTALGVKGKMDPDHFPLHKAKLMAATFFNGKIVQDRFKVFDGLRAWAVIFLVFTRKLPAATGAIGPLVKLPNASDEDCVKVAKRLMVLQDLRNPAAHRQTYTDLSTVMIFRKEAIQLLNTILKFYE